MAVVALMLCASPSVWAADQAPENGASTQSRADDFENAIFYTIDSTNLSICQSTLKILTWDVEDFYDWYPQFMTGEVLERVEAFEAQLEDVAQTLVSIEAALSEAYEEALQTGTYVSTVSDALMEVTDVLSMLGDESDEIYDILDEMQDYYEGIEEVMYDEMSDVWALRDEVNANEEYTEEFKEQVMPWIDELDQRVADFQEYFYESLLTMDDLAACDIALTEIRIQIDNVKADIIAAWEAYLSGITDAAVDANTEAKYYDLNGRQVLNPEAGRIYIMRQGSAATKVIK